MNERSFQDLGGSTFGLRPCPRRLSDRKNPERQPAIISLDQPVNRDPAAARPYQGSGSIHAAQGNLQRSVKDFDEAIRLDPKFVQAYYSRGFVYNRLGQPLRATEDFNRAILLDPDVAEGYLGRGEAHAVLKQIPQAIENYGEANQAWSQFLQSLLRPG